MFGMYAIKTECVACTKASHGLVQNTNCYSHTYYVGTYQEE